jgi:hypothetical protein
MGAEAQSRTPGWPGCDGRVAARPAPRVARRLVASLTLALALAGAGGLAAPAEAQQAANGSALRDRVFGRNLPPTGRYVSEQGVSFVLDRTSGRRPLLRFDGRTETWALRPSPAPRGDIIYRTDAGDQVLRITADGGMTLYTVQEPRGTPVSAVGPAEPLRPDPIGPAELSRLLIRQSGLATRALGRTVLMEAPDVLPGSEALVADTASVAVDAVARVARAENLRGRATRLRRILIVNGDRPDVRLLAGTLRITIQPTMGAAGRPSSALILQAVADGG